MSGPAVAVLIVNWNTRDLLTECLESVFAQGGPCFAQVVVVDNASGDGSAERVRACFPRVMLVASDENLGFVGGNNRAYRLADPGARYVLLLNPDAALRPGALAAMVGWMDAHPEAGACGPLTLNTDGTLQVSWSRFPTVAGELRGREDRRFADGRRPPRLTLEAMRALPDPVPVDWVSGACLLVRRSLVAGPLGGVLLDPAFHMYSEETDLCLRLRRAGAATFLLPRAEVVHHYGQSSRQAPLRTVRLLYQSKYLFFRKHYGPRSAHLLRAGVALTAGLKWLACALLCLPPTGRRAGLALQRDRQRAVLESLGRRPDRGAP